MPHWFIYCLLLICLLPGFARASGGLQPQQAAPERYPDIIRLDELLAFSEQLARADHPGRVSDAAKPLPAYIQALLADGRLTIGLGLGTEDLGALKIPKDPQLHRLEKTVRLWGRHIVLEARFILTREDFARALNECEVLFVSSHSRFGAGPVFRSDGKGFPFLMQQTKGYEIVMPDDEICGFSGKIKRRFYSREKDRSYTVFEPDSSDLAAVRPLHGYQLLVLSTCTSKKHFDDELKSLRAGYPTTAVYTTRAACLDPGMNVFMRLLAEIFQARQIPELVAALNQEYKTVAERLSRKGSRAWKKVDTMYQLGFDTLQ